ncbi:hypothetical protein LX36DRAFT_128706 [Colletotrichum falcatum]|nr:hypothetical protein LX36DRAFT_128706 [Colletotrichum falcatum]
MPVLLLLFLLPPPSPLSDYLFFFLAGCRCKGEKTWYPRGSFKPTISSPAKVEESFGAILRRTCKRWRGTYVSESPPVILAKHKNTTYKKKKTRLQNLVRNDEAVMASVSIAEQDIYIAETEPNRLQC